MSRKDFYLSKIWRQTARYIWLKQHCLCGKCGKPVYVDGISPYLPKEKRLVGVVHHIIPINETNYKDDSVALNEDNLIGLCQNCHAIIHGDNVVRDGLMFDEMGNLIPSNTPHS